MRYVVVGYGNIGRRRAALLGPRCVATVDPTVTDATHARLDDVPAAAYDAAILAVPTPAKLAYLERLLSQGTSALVEKPVLFASSSEADALAAAARGAAVWYTSYNHRFEPLVARLKVLLDEGAVGRPDRARLLYGNGTVRHWAGTWRERGSGVLEDLGCHLLDLAGWLLGRAGEAWTLWDLRPVESATFDYALFSTEDRRVICEVGNVFWKNTFRIEVYGDAGSLHLDGLGKWGGPTLTCRRRVVPSGPPVESVETAPAGDSTWEADLREFERRVAAGESSLETDRAMSETITSLLEQAGAHAGRREASR